ncbi:hypothetical protein [uncultured Methylobacterium sp.]|uniref:hypothetical protein n=1 Tax=uncultured Methylobacterium sp. TaxID=157278 RepID=UPI0025898ED0|nr:hypothetical protein [uncultured Methylobacterium sp.]
MRSLVVIAFALTSSTALAQGQVAPVPVPNRTAGDNSSAPANTRYVDAAVQALLTALQARAPVANPTFTGRVKIPALDLTGTGSTGSVSGFCVLPVWGDLCRSLTDRAGEVVNYLDVTGSDPSGVTQQMGPLTSAMARAKSAGRGLVLPYGSFNLTGGTVTLPNNLPLEFGPGVTFNTNGNYIDGTGDFTPFIGTSAVRGFMRRSDYAGNQHTVFANVDAVPSAGSVNYIKSAVFAYASTSDPSIYPDGSPGGNPQGNKDAVGVLANAEIRGGIQTGRVWAGNLYAGTRSDSDGLVTGLEIDVANRRAHAETLGQVRGQTGLSLITLGTYNATQALLIGGDKGSKWAYGINIQANDLTKSAFRLITPNTNDGALADLDPAGNWSAQKFTATGGNPVALAGASAAGAAASLYAMNGPLALSGSGSNPTYLGSSASPTVAQGAAVVGTTLSVAGAVGFNNAAPVGKCTLPAALPTDGSASNAAIASAVNAARSCLITVGLAQ